MAFEKGHQKIGGRKKSSTNTLKHNIRERVILLIEGKWNVVSEDLDNLDSKSRLDVIIRLMDFTIPKLSRIEMDKSPSLCVKGFYKYTSLQKQILFHLQKLSGMHFRK